MLSRTKTATSWRYRILIKRSCLASPWHLERAFSHLITIWTPTRSAQPPQKKKKNARRNKLRYIPKGHGGKMWQASGMHRLTGSTILIRSSLPQKCPSSKDSSSTSTMASSFWAVMRSAQWTSWKCSVAASSSLYLHFWMPLYLEILLRRLVICSIRTKWFSSSWIKRTRSWIVFSCQARFKMKFECFSTRLRIPRINKMSFRRSWSRSHQVFNSRSTIEFTLKWWKRTQWSPKSWATATLWTSKWSNQMASTWEDSKTWETHSDKKARKLRKLVSNILRESKRSKTSCKLSFLAWKHNLLFRRNSSSSRIKMILTQCIS